jgi:hypothetical protein
LDRLNEIADGEMAAIEFAFLSLSLSLSLSELSFFRLLVSVGVASEPDPSDFLFSLERARRLVTGDETSFKEQVADVVEEAI